MALNTKATYLLPPISGAGQTSMASDTLVAASTVQTLSNKVLNSPLVGSDSITGQLNGMPCTGSTNETRINLIVIGTIGNGFGWLDIGSAVKWADGTTSIIADAPVGSVPGDRWRKDGRIYDTVVRTNMACTFYEAISQTIASNSHFSSPGTLNLHAGSAVVTISNEKSTNRVRETWFFPPVVAGTYRNDTFVGEAAVQTLSNKALKAVSSIEFKPATDGTWNAVNLESVPQTWTPPRPAATGTTSFDSYETLTMQMRMTGHFGTIGGDSTTARYLTVLFTRIGKTVTMTIRRYVEESNKSRPAGTIGTDPNSPFPAVFRPVDDQSFYMRVINAGVFAFGSCFVSKAGTFSFAAGPLGEAFTAIPANTPQWSGFESVAGQWVMP